MLPKPVPDRRLATDMFRNRLENMIDIRHELVRIANVIN